MGRPAGIAPGSEIGIALAINFGPLPLEPGKQYVWQLQIDGHADDTWRCPFAVRPLPAPGAVSLP